MKRLLSVVSLILSASISFAAENENFLNERTLTVSASAQEESAPDTVKVALSIETFAKTAREAASLNSSRAEDVVKALKKTLGPADKIKTSAYSIHPVYESEGIGRKETLTGFRAVNQLNITTNKTGSTGEIIDVAVESGANRVSEVRFDLIDTAGLCERLITEASAKALSRARAAAEAFGTKLSGTKSIEPSCGADIPQPSVRLYSMEAGMKGGATPTPIEPGTIRVSSGVNAVFYLEEAGE